MLLFPLSHIHVGIKNNIIAKYLKTEEMLYMKSRKDIKTNIKLKNFKYDVNIYRQKYMQ